MIVFKGIAHPDMCDVMGHMTTRHYIAMFDDASYHFLYQAFGWSGVDAKTKKIGWADVRHEIDYHCEVAEGSLVELTAKLIKLGKKSIKVQYDMHNVATNELAASLVSTSVYFDLNSRKAISLTESMRTQASPYLYEDK
jgi:acyl-CoA thioester hydrolase